MSMLKKTLIYLGLGPDEEYDAFDEYAPNPDAPSAAPAARPTMRAVADPTPAPVVQSATVRPITPSRPEPSGSVRVVASPDAGSSATAEQAPAPAAEPSKEAPGAVRIVENRTASPHAMSPTTFNDAQGIGDRFKAGQPVIVNLQGADRDLRRRLVDFASGLCYALGGKMDRVADQVYLLTPADVEVSAADRRAFD